VSPEPGLVGRDLISLADLSADEIRQVLATAGSFAEINQRAIKKVPSLRGRTIVNLFLEPSTRTRTSFELAGKRLSADVVNVSGSASATAKGESLKDTALTLEAMASDMIIIRHKASGSAKMLADLVDIPVVNGGDGRHEHPTQALLDLFTIGRHRGEVSGLTVGIVGDISHSRVARSNIVGMKALGARVICIGPPTLMPAEVESLGVEVSYDLDAVLGELDVIYVLRLQLERQGQGLLPSLREYATLWGISRSRLAKAKPDVMVMHPGPMNRGVEIAGDVADLPQALITEQVTSGVAVRMAVIYLLLGGVAPGAAAAE
jgi:aspartate carbamoyltransferase catalytic subunit